jgi:hypothetical protein
MVEDYSYYGTIFYSCYLSFTFYVITKYHYIEKRFKSESQFILLFLVVMFLNVGLTHDLLSGSSKLRMLLSEANEYMEDLRSSNAELIRLLKNNGG